MKFASSQPSKRRRAKSAFTLAEVLAALMFMAIVIPVAVEGLRIASLAAQVGERKGVAARMAERVLNEIAITGESPGGSQSGTFMEGVHEYRWTIEYGQWSEGTMRTATVRVTYQVQGRDFEVDLTTLTSSATI